MIAFLPPLLEGAIVTVKIAAGASLVALLFAFAAGLARHAAPWPVRWLAIGYIEFFRGTSLLIQLFWFFFVLPQFGVTMSALAVAILGIGLNYGAYGAEIVRGAVQGVPAVQRKAAASLGLRPVAIYVFVVLPQAAITMIRPWGNLLIQLLKATSLVSLITITEITFRAYQLNQLTARTGEIFAAVLLVYFLIASAIATGTDYLDARTRRWQRAGAY